MTEQAAIFENNFIHHFQRVNEIIKSNQTETVIVGGIALRSAMNKPIESRRPNGTIPDIDIIGLGPNPQNIKDTTFEIKKYRQDFPDCPPVSLESVTFSNHPSEKYSPLEFVSGLRKDNNGRYFLTFRKIDAEIDSLTMVPISRKYGSISISTLPQETIYYRYLLRMGYIKPKDISKLEEFRHYIENGGGDGLNPELFNSYQDFIQQMNQKYPNIINLTKTYWNFDQSIGGKISGSNGIFYEMINSFRRN